MSKIKISKREREIAVNFMHWTMSGDCIWECTDEDQWELIDGYGGKDEGMKTTDELFDIYLESWKEHLEGLQKVDELGGPRLPLSKEVEEILKAPIRNPCEYCGEKHLDYACDSQIESIKKQYNIN
jgi:hypothetical protein